MLLGHSPTSLFRCCNYCITGEGPPHITQTPYEAETERELADKVIPLGWGVAKNGQAESSGVWLSFYCPDCMQLGPSHNPELHLGNMGPAVTKARTLLHVGIDPLFDETLEIAVKAYQKFHELEQTGIVDLATWKKLDIHPEIAARCDFEGSGQSE